MKTTDKEKDSIKCSFCGRDKQDTAVLIAESTDTSAIAALHRLIRSLPMSLPARQRRVEHKNLHS